MRLIFPCVRLDCVSSKIISTRPLFASPYKFGAPDCILEPDLGPILVLVLDSIFRPRFVALDFV